TKALERLAVLMAGSGRVKESEEWHRRKALVDRAHDKYRKTLFDGEDLSSRAAELSELTTTLGRPFDARGRSILAETQLHDPAPAAPGNQPAAASPLPKNLRSKAMELSSGYTIRARSVPSSSAHTLAEDLVALRTADGAPIKAAGSPNKDSARSVPAFVDDA